MWEFCLIGIALAMDCFTVSIATGIAYGHWVGMPMTLSALSFGIFQGGMTLLGYWGMYLLSSNVGFIRDVDHWIAFSLLLYLGMRMIRHHGDDREGEALTLDARSILLLSVATSIDALAVGMSMACDSQFFPLNRGAEGVFSLLTAHSSLLTAALVIAMFSTVMSLAGYFIGLAVGKVRSDNAEALAGIVLVCIGAKILVEHLFF